MAIVNSISKQLADSTDSRKTSRCTALEHAGFIKSSYAQVGDVPGTNYSDSGNAYEPINASDSGAKIDLLNLPYGSIRIHPSLSTFRTSIASGTIKVGIRQYTSDNTIISEQSDVFTNGAGGSTLSSTSDVASSLGTIIDYNVYSNRGITIFVEVDGAILDTDWFECRIFFTTM